MEGVGAVASSIALCQAIEKIAKLIKKMKNAQQKWDQYHRELKLLHDIVYTIETSCNNMQGPVTPTVNIDGQEVTLIQYCFENINICILDAKNFLDKYNRRKIILRDVRQFFRIWKRAQWVYKEDDIQDLFDRVVYARDCLNMVLSAIKDQRQSHEHAITQQILRSQNDEMVSKLQALQDHYENNIQKFQSASIEIRECAEVLKQSPRRAVDLLATPAHEGFFTCGVSPNTGRGDRHNERAVSGCSHNGNIVSRDCIPDRDTEAKVANNEGQYGTTSTALIPFDNPATPDLASEKSVLPKTKTIGSCDVKVLFLDGSCLKIPAGLDFIPGQESDNDERTATALLLEGSDSEGTRDGPIQNDMALIRLNQHRRSLSSARQFESFLCRQDSSRWKRLPSEFSDDDLSSGDDSGEGRFEIDSGFLESYDGGTNQKLLRNGESGEDAISIENNATVIENRSDESTEDEEADGNDESSSSNEEDGSDVSDENDQVKETDTYEEGGEASTATFRSGNLRKDDSSVTSSYRDTEFERDIPFYPKRERVSRVSHVAPETARLSAKLYFNEIVKGCSDGADESTRIGFVDYHTTALLFCIRSIRITPQSLEISKPCRDQCDHGRILILDDDSKSTDLSSFNWVNIVQIEYRRGLRSFVHPERGATIRVFQACETGCTHTRVFQDGRMCSSYFMVSGWPMRGEKENHNAGSCSVQ